MDVSLPMRLLFATTTLLALLLAGCASEPDGPPAPTSAECIEQGLILNETEGACVEPPFEVQGFEDPQHFCVVNQDRDRVHAPDLVGDPWELGQYWEYSLQVSGEDLGTTRLVYYANQDFAGGIPQHYMVGTPTREEALRHALFSENPMMGRVHRILYSPHESGDHADMFHFPLCEGSTWNSVFYGETFTLTARSGEVRLPGGPAPGFIIEGTSGEGSDLRLSYSPEAQWFTFIDLDRADGTTVDMQLEAMGEGHTGQVFFLRGQKDVVVPLGGEVPAVRTTPVVRDAGDEGPYETIGLHVSATLQGDGQYTVALVDPAGAIQWEAELGAVSGNGSVEQILELPFTEGEWTLRETLLPPLATGATVDGALRIVSVYDRSGEL